MNTKKSLILYILTVTGILILVNILANRFFFRLDFTEDNRYTLSEATKNILKELNDPVTVTAYFSKDLPPQIAQTRSDFKDLLVEYANKSKRNVLYEFINPNEKEETEQEAMKAGISPVVINVREKDQAVQKKAYLGAVIKYGDKSEVIPFMQQGAAMEYALSTSIKKLTVNDKPLIGFIQGHGEPSLSEFQQAMASLSVLYNVETVNLTDSTNLNKYKTVCMAAPTDSIPAGHIEMLDQFLAGGGNLYIAVNRVLGDLGQLYGSELTTGLESWLASKGLTVAPNFVIDAQCATVNVQQQQGMFTFNTQMTFPYLPMANNFADHAVTKGLENVLFEFVSPLNFTGDTSIRYQPLVYSSDKSGTQNCPVFFNIQQRWTENDFPLSKLTLAALLEGKLAGNADSKLVVVGDGDFAVNGAGQTARQRQPDNVSLMVNAIDYLSDDTGLIDLRTKEVTSRPIDQLEDGTKTLLKYLNFLLPVLLIIAIGLINAQRNRIRRMKRMYDDYV
ncbi:MAG: Gldg family protein [Prolixibacteraceae bacterium]|jgi:gliding-associated putative ABC transporter substrate-binding component GldG|nr:Gldg family protein [Prolixibacteraceae bacterium]